MRQSLKDIVNETRPVENKTERRPGKNTKKITDDLLVPMPRMKMVKEKVLRVKTSPKMTHPEKVIAIIRAAYDMMTDGEEHSCVVTLDHNLKFINLWFVGRAVRTKNGRPGADVEAKDVFRRVLADDHAAKFIFCHNHPSGEIEMSEEDWEVLQDLKHDGQRMGTPMVDFIIIGDGTDEYYSHKDDTYELSA